MQPEARSATRASLAAVQRGLLGLITGREMGGITPAASSLVHGDARASAAARLHVYQHMYVARMVEALESQFPRLARLRGPDDFAELVHAYIACEPSTNPSLRFVGERLPDWLELRRPSTPWLADLARLEWARADVFDAADEPLMTTEELRAWPADELGSLPLGLVAAHELVIVDYAIGDYWDAIGRPDGPGEGPAAEADDRAGESLLVWRQGSAVYHRAVDARELAALERLADGTTFGALCEALLGHLPAEGATRQAFAWLSTWIADEILVAARA